MENLSYKGGCDVYKYTSIEMFKSRAGLDYRSTASADYQYKTVIPIRI